LVFLPSLLLITIFDWTLAQLCNVHSRSQWPCTHNHGMHWCGTFKFIHGYNNFASLKKICKQYNLLILATLDTCLLHHCHVYLILY
jgi:hypothetical protein